MTTDLDDLARRYRPAALALVEFYLRMTREIAAEFDGDLELAVLIMEIGAATNAPIFVRGGQPGALVDGDVPIPPVRQRPLSKKALAAIVGRPRETVRRQVDRLKVAGMIIDDPRGGVRLAPGLVQGRFMPAIAGGLGRLNTLIDQVKPTGLIRESEV